MSEPSPKRVRIWLARTVYAGVAAVTVPVVLARVLPFQVPYPLSAAEAEATWVLLLAWAGLALAVVLRHRRVAALFGVVALVHALWALEWVPRIEAGTRPAGTALRVVTANLLAPEPSREAARALLATDADVIVVQELSDPWDATLREAGVYDAYPFRVTEPHALEENYFGIGILSRRPITSSEVTPLVAARLPLARADLDVGGATVRVYAVHTVPPKDGALLALLERQADVLAARMRRDTADARLAAVIVAGDFNASPTARVYRTMLATGVTEAHEAVGRGLTTTWPNGVFPYPPMRLDHVFVHGAYVSRVRELDAGRSDHAPVVVDLVLPHGASHPRSQ